MTLYPTVQRLAHRGRSTAETQDPRQVRPSAAPTSYTYTNFLGKDTANPNGMF